jgi:hypothetical protein
MKKYAFYFLGLFISLNAWSLQYRGGDLTFAVNGTNVTFNVVLYTEGVGTVADSLDIDAGTGSYEFIYLISDTIIDNIHKSVYSKSRQYPGPGIYVITVFIANRVQGIGNIPGSINEPICLHAKLVLSPFFTYSSSPLFANDHFNKLILSDTVFHNIGAYDIDGDSLSFELVDCLGENCEDIGGYVYPNDFGGFENIDTNGVLVYSIPLQVRMQFAIKVTKWRMGVDICSAYRDILMENYNVDVSEITSFSTFNLFPNPASDNFMLQFISKFNFDSEVEIVNSIGEMVFIQPLLIHCGENLIQLNCSNLSDGIYFLRIGKSDLQKKFIIQN